MNLRIIGSLAGLSASLVFSASWIIAVCADPSWVLGENTLSDLGVSSYGAAEAAFNIGCIVSGILASICGLCMTVCTDGRWTGASVFLAGLFLAMVGVFTKDSMALHLLSAYSLAVCALVAELSSLRSGSASDRLVSSFTAVLLIITMSSVAGQSFAMAEAVAVACLLAWLTIQSIGVSLNRTGDGARMRCQRSRTSAGRPLRMFPPRTFPAASVHGIAEGVLEPLFGAILGVLHPCVRGPE